MRKFGKYEILTELKSGGMGDVLLGRRRGPGGLEQLVAIKTIRPEYASAPAVRAMFFDEQTILARLNHPGVATVHDFGEEDGVLFMAMEYVAGIPFRDVAELRPPPGVVARAIAEACRGLHAAHELRDTQGNVLGVVHRDISPDNLMLGYDGHVKVIDFGIALMKKREAPMTEIGTVKGKPPYMSPEQVKNEAMDRRSDVFSLGVVAWEMLTNQPLFDGDSVYAIAIAVERQVIAPPSSVAGELPLGLDGAVLNALDRDVASRTPTAAALAEALESVIGAAGSETLEAWAEYALEQPRLDHRAWLAQVTAGEEAVAPRIGRPTGMQTALPEVAAVLPQQTQVPAAQPSEPAADVEAEPQPRRRGAGVMIAAVLVLLVGGAGVLLLTHHGDDTPVIASVKDASVRDAPTPVIVPMPVDAAAPADATAVIEDAAVPVPLDAGHTVHRDAAVILAPRLDAAAKPAVDAAPAEPALAGTGTLVLTAGAGAFANVVIDGNAIGPTPLRHYKIAAGKHTVKFLDPTNGAVLATQTVTVHDGDKLDVHP